MRKAAVSAVLVAVLAVAGVACGDQAAEPTIPTVDFAPKGTLTVDDAGITCVMTDSPDVCRIASGSVVEAVNHGDGDHRLVATLPDQVGNTFDTGIMQPGDTTTIVLTVEGSFTVTDQLDPQHTVVLEVVPRL